MNGDRAGELLEAVRLDGLRGVIARGMTESLRRMAQFTLHRQVEAAPLLRFHKELAGKCKPSINDLVLAATAKALAQHPALNATLEGETIFRWRPVHLGMAVAVEAGLVVPVIRSAQELSLASLTQQTTRLIRLARNGGLAMADLQDGTFTVTNLGSLGVDAFTPIINPPQVAILGVGRIAHGVMTLSLTIDHRALDGAPAGRFLQDLADCLENPGRHQQC